MQLSVNLKMLIDFCKNQKRQTLGFSSPAHLPLYSPASNSLELLGSGLLRVKKKLFTHSAFRLKIKTRMLFLCVFVCVLKFSFYWSCPRESRQSRL